MNVNPFARFFGNWWSQKHKRKTKQRRAKRPDRRVRLNLETLEDRAVPAINTIPFIESVIPVDGSSVNDPLPVLQILFSEEMEFGPGAGAANPANYLLINSDGEPISIQQIDAFNTSVNGVTKTQVTLDYNDGQDLIVDNYTLYVHGDQLFDVDDGFPMAPGAKLVVANGGTNNIEVVTLFPDGTLGTPMQYPLPFEGFFNNTPPNPNAILFADLDGDGHEDMLVANATTHRLAIFLGRGAEFGNGYSLTPDLLLDLPPGINNQPKSIVVGDFNDNDQLDIAVANAGSDEISIFLNADLAGFLDFLPAVNYAAGNSPRSLVITDFDGNGTLDLAVANNAINGVNFNVTILRGVGDGTFVAAQTLVVGVNDPNNNNVTGVHNPSDLVLGQFDADLRLDLAVSGSNGIRILNNNSTTPGFINFGVGTIISTTNTPAMAAGDLNGNTFDDIVAATGAGVVWFEHDGNGNFSPTLIHGPAGTARVRLADLNNDGNLEILVANNATPSRVSVLQQVNMTGAVEDATPTNPVVITSTDHGLTTGTRVTIFGVGGIPQANGTFTITRINADQFSLNGVSGTGAYTGGGIWSAEVVGVPGSPFRVGQGVAGLALGDINGDGFLDFGTANPGTNANNVTVYYGNGDTTFRRSQEIPGIFPTLRAVAVGDLNGDGIPDIVVVNNTTSSTNTRVTVALGLPAGGYSAPLSYTVSNPNRNLQQLTSVAIGDIDGDGRPDIVFVGQRSGGPGGPEYRLGVLQNNIAADDEPLTATSFSPAFLGTFGDLQIGDRPTQLVLADFNNDGRLDVAVSHDGPGGGFNSTNRGVSVRLNTSTGGNFSFGALQQLVRGIFVSSLVVGDFNRDGNLDFIAAEDSFQGRLHVRYGNGDGTFTNGGTFNTGLANLVGIAAADFNLDGFLDVVAISGSTFSTLGGAAVLLNQLGTGFGSSNQIEVMPGTPLRSVVTTDLNRDGKPDIVISLGSSAFGFNQDNIFALYGAGDGTFPGMVPYLAGQPGNVPAEVPSYLAVTDPPLVRVTTFRSGGTLVSNNLIINGDFEGRDLNNEQGNLSGWTTFALPDNPGGSHGRWGVQTATLSPTGTTISISPLSSEPVPRPTGNFQVMLDQQSKIPIFPGFSDPNPASSYQGSHALYQDVVIPANVSEAFLSLNLYLNNFAANWSDTNLNPLLDYRTPAANQQVRVDLIDPTVPGGSNPLTISAGVLETLFRTEPNEESIQLLTLGPVDLTAYAGRTLRLRIAATNNQGRLLVGVDNVQLQVIFSDTIAPTLSNLQLQNPGVIISGIPHTTDPTIIGKAGDNGSPANIEFVEFAPNNNFGGPGTFKIINFDTTGNFSFTIPNLAPGLHTIGVRVVDRVGNETFGEIDMILLDLNSEVWQAYGPNALAVNQTTLGFRDIEFESVSGRITEVVTDPRDASGNTYYVGTANGGIWKTFNGGNSWVPLTDYVTDANGNPTFVPIGALTISRSNPDVLYAGLGVADLEVGSRAGRGILKTTDGGLTWVVVGNSATVFLNARISRIVIDSNDANQVYVGVASGGQFGPGVYRSIDGGLTWTNVLDPTKMFDPNGNPVPVGTSLPSVTDLLIDPFNSNRLLVGLGNIGLAPGANHTFSGVWRTINKGDTWQWIQGATNTQQAAAIVNGRNIGSLPSGFGVGRITMAMGSGRPGDENTTYFLISTPPGANIAPSVNFGQTGGPNENTGLFKSDDNMLNFTRVRLMEFQTRNPAAPNEPLFQHLRMSFVDGTYAAALAVDPGNVNVVYVGGSRRFTLTTAFVKSLIRVDTGNMLSSVDSLQLWFTRGAFAPRPEYAGDDFDKFLEALFLDLTYSGSGAVTYRGEGVYWYDIEQNGVNDRNNVTRIYPTIHSLTFDGQGRLLIGTEGGIWRGTSLGYSYDFTTGGFGILGRESVFPLPTPVIPGMTLTNLNNNLQTLNLTSVSVDPNNPSTLYTSQISLGSSSSADLLDWISNGFTGPGGFLIPTVARVVAAAPPPGTPADTPTTLFRVWQYANVNALLPEVSADGGQTWLPLFNTGINTNDRAFRFPPFVINPTPVFDSGVWSNELLFGTDKVYLSRTTANVWDPITPARLSNQGGVITAVAAAPSNPPLTPSQSAYYAGTNLGEVFVTLNTGADGMPLRNAGLPTGVPVNAIVVDPRDNQTAYVMFAGAAAGNVWRTTNGGLSWTNISANLPNVPAYDMVVTTNSTAQAPNGKLIVATEVGVFISLDSGASWDRFGQGLPNVPVVHLSYNPDLGLLGVATQGRGAFTIEVDDIGPRIVSIQNSLTQNAFTVTFSEAINPSTFTVEDVTLRGPADNVVPVTGLVNLVPALGNQFQITFPAGSTPGAYTVEIGPNIADLVGNLMDQNQNRIQGEVPQDQYRGRFIYQPAGNIAPTLGNTAPTLPGILEDVPAATNFGVDLVTFINGLNISDPDPNALRGIAVTGVDEANGTWQYSRDGGLIWNNFGAVTEEEARLLEQLPTNRIRFLPIANYFGPATFTFRAWDLTSDLTSFDGSDGGIGDASINGGSAAYSAQLGTATLDILPVNDPPSFNRGSNQTVLEDAGPQTVNNWATGISPGPPNESGQSVFFIVIGNTNPGLFSDPPAVSPTGTLTFTSAPDAFGVATITIVLRDDGGTANGGQDTSAPQSFTITVLPVNDAPTFDVQDHVSVPAGSGPQVRTGWVTNMSPGPPNESNQTLTIQITGNTDPSLFAAGGLPSIDLNGTLRFTPAAAVKGVATISVTLSDDGGTANGGVDSTTKTFTIAVNTPPVLNPIPDRSFPHTQDTDIFNLNPFIGPNPDGDPLTFLAPVVGGSSPLYELDQQLGLFRHSSGYFQNSFGLNEKWLQAANEGNAWYFILEDGRLYKWNGASGINALNSTLVANVGASVWANPALLHDAVQPAAPTPAQVSVTIDGSNNLIIDPAPNFAGQFRVTVTLSDGFDTASQTFVVTVTNTAPDTIIPDGTVSRNGTFLSDPLPFTDLDGDLVSYSISNSDVTNHSQELVTLKNQLGLPATVANYAQNWGGQNEKWIPGSGGRWFFLLPNGELRRWLGGSAGAILNNSILVTRVASTVWANPALLHNAQPPLTSPSPVASILGGNQVQVDPDSGNNFVGLLRVTVHANDGLVTVPVTFFLNVTNTAPIVFNPGSQSFVHGQNSLTFTINGADDDGDTLDFGIQVLETLLFNLDQQHGFPQVIASYSQNWGGQNEKWLRAANGTWYFLLDTGELRRWHGTGSASAILANSTRVEMLAPSVWANPAMLHDAVAPPPVTVSKNVLSPTSSEITLTLSPLWGGTFTVIATANDGLATSAPEYFQVTSPNNAPVFVSPPADFTMHHSEGSRNINITATDPDGDFLTYEAVVEQKVFTFGGSYSQNWGGQNEKWINAQDGWHFILPNGELRRWHGTGPASALMANSTVVAQLDPSVWGDPALLWNNAGKPNPPATVTISGSHPGPVTATIDPHAQFSGVFQVRIRARDGYVNNPAEKLIYVTVTNQPIQLDPIANRGMNSLDTTFQEQMTVPNREPGEQLTWNVQLVAADNPAYALNLQYAFEARVHTPNFYGLNEKWFKATRGIGPGESPWFALLPDGRFYQLTQASPFGRLVATLSTQVYNNPALLWNAQPGTAPNATASVIENSMFSYTLNLDFHQSVDNSFWIIVTVSDGPSSATRGFLVTVF